MVCSDGRLKVNRACLFYPPLLVATAASAQVTFAPGQTSKTLAIGVKGDTAREGYEVLFVNLTQGAGANRADAQGQGTILNDDGPVLAIADVTLAEGHGTRTANFRVTLTPALVTGPMMPASWGAMRPCRGPSFPIQK